MSRKVGNSPFVRLERRAVTPSLYGRFMEPTKRCTKCGKRFPLAMFYAAKGTRDGLRGDCKECFAARAAKRYREDPDRVKQRVLKWQRENRDRYRASQRRIKQSPEGKRREREGHLRRTHGITQADYDAMVEAQKGRCKICGRRPAEGKSFHIDHDHVTGRIRGLLCSSCNHALGLFAESPERLRRAASYVTRPKSSYLVRQRLERELLRQQ